MKNNKGITLLALIITIIVMLILAGVSMNMIVGEEGIIKKAEEGAKISEEKHFYETIATSITYGSDGKKNLNKTEENVKKNIENATTEMVDDSLLKITVVGKYGTYDYTLGEEGNASQTDASAYGKVVTNYKTISAGYSGDWEIFYADNKNVYLISSEPVGKGKLTRIDGNGNYYDLGNITEGQINNYPAIKAGWINKVYDLENNILKVNQVNSGGMLWLLDSRNWNKYVDSNHASWAIGAPTMELLVASYNTALYTTDVYINEPTEVGYENPFTSKQLGVLDTSRYHRGNSYWLACPSKFGSGQDRGIFMLKVSAVDGVTNNSRAFENESNFRPVVCLKSSVVLEAHEYEENGTIKNYEIKE